MTRIFQIRGVVVDQRAWACRRWRYRTMPQRTLSAPFPKYGHARIAPSPAASRHPLPEGEGLTFRMVLLPLGEGGPKGRMRANTSYSLVVVDEVHFIQERPLQRFSTTRVA